MPDAAGTMQSISGVWPILGLGMLGGLAIEVMRWWKLRTSEQFPQFARSPAYWLITASMIVIGGVLATLYGLDGRNPIAIVQLGASAPALLGAMASGRNIVPGAQGDGDGESEDSSSTLAGAEKSARVRLSSKRKGKASSVASFLSFSG